MTQAYKGYLICRGLCGDWNIKKDGYHICYATTLEVAKGIIDQLVE